MRAFKLVIELGFWFFALFACVGIFCKVTSDLYGVGLPVFNFYLIWIFNFFLVFIPAVVCSIERISKCKAWDFLGE
ncbi:hypothetical protein [Pseudomonas citronellolis]|uniref:hypothetical protein n=1 Tax=Pseudomonas citronellolis TaxID=53408 RepID=UPI0023E36436|nr:hypothetical protein [Pseudomonas citronellolis]MDF3933398.1 hypothetical protein [Pseudomonas citronellolis]